MSKKKKKSSPNGKAAEISRKKLSWTAVIPFILLGAVFGYLILSGRLSLKPEDSKEESAAESSESVAPQESAESLEADTIFPVNLGNGIELSGIGSYAGYYVEDGSDVLVSGIPVITLENKGTEAVRLMNLELADSEGRVYQFELTTLLPGARISVLEKNKAQYHYAAKIVAVNVTRYSAFDEVPKLPTDVLQLMSSGSKISVRNISDGSVKNVHLYYKNLSGGLLIGGITYSVSIPDLAPGESVTLTPSHYTDGSSRILFITYGE